MRRVRRDRYDAVWRPVWGEYKTIRNHYNELTIDLRKQVAPRRSLQLVFRVFNDGLGFRYVLPRQRAMDRFAITEEDTQFKFARDFTAWWIPAQFGPGSGDEELWRRTAVSKMDAAATPVTVDAGDAGYATLHEADLIDYAAMIVAPDEAGGPSLRSALVASPDGVKVRGTAPHKSPWRTLVIGDTPGDLIESTLILNLNDPCAICHQDTSWIKPGKYVGVWWEIHKGQSEWSTEAALPHGATTENTKRYIDFAAAHGIPYVLAEGWNEGWATRYSTQDFLTPTPDFDLNEVVAYASSKGVNWLAHNETGGNVTNYIDQIEPAFSNTWDDTKVINGQIGDCVTVARKSGRDWFVGSISDEQSKTLSVPLRFLERRKLYVANIYGDAPTTDLETNPNQVQITRVIVDSRDRLTAPMAAGGGQAVHLTPATAQDTRTLPRCGSATPLCERASD